MYDWNWRVVVLYKDVFLQGALVTLELTAAAVLIGTCLGVILSLLRRTGDPVLGVLVRLYIELFRSVPVLVLLIWVYYVLPILFDVRLSGFTTTVIALSASLAAFVAETVRAGIESVPLHQFESAAALGLQSSQVMRRIIWPQAIRNMIPNLIGLYVTELKNSALASIIAVDELLHRSEVLIGQTYRTLEIYTVLALVYLVIIIPFTLLSRWYERRVHGKANPLLGV